SPRTNPKSFLPRNKIPSPPGLPYRNAFAEDQMTPLGKRLADGEPSACAELYDLCAARCHHYLVVRLGSREAADEVLQNVFVRLVRQRPWLANVENLLACTFAVARNEAARFAERLGREARR